MTSGAGSSASVSVCGIDLRDYQLEAMIKGRALRIEWEGTESSRFKVQCLRSETI
jgi:hypothetical protein